MHTFSMARRPRSNRSALYEGYRKDSGWWLAAWRDFKNLTLTDLAADLGRSVGYVSDLETGAHRPGRAPSRFNKDIVEEVSQALGVPPGRLLDVNPFEWDERQHQLAEIFGRLDEGDRAAIFQMAERLDKQSAA